MARILKATAIGGAAVLIVALAAAGWGWNRLHASLPLYDGEFVLAGLHAPVIVERDALGVVTLRSESVLDEARALGFVHAQERYFQMDLLRRSAAGELAALVGAGAIDVDQRRRVHRMRRTAQEVVRTAPDEYRALLDAYTGGVNAGLDALGARPPEYHLLRAAPAPWLPEDSVLVIAAMYFDLQGGTALSKRHEHVARGVLPPEFAAFLYPARTSWDAPLVGDAAPPAPVPDPSVYDLRQLPPAYFDAPALPQRAPLPFGSNNWAVSGEHTASGGGLLANDMHLGLGVPSIWFRVSMARGGATVTGITLPGQPFTVAGSNGHVAWGYTNSYGDWLDLIVLELHPEDADVYLTPEGWQQFETVSSPIEVVRGPARDFEFKATIWGPVMGALPDGRPYAVRWVAHDPRGYAPAFVDLGRVRDVAGALVVAQRSGIPAQNFVVADRHGDVGWTVMGPIPRRVRHGGVSLSSQGPAWDGWLEPAEYPAVADPPTGRVWTANARVVDGDMLERIGDGGYSLGVRARQIRDRLLALENATPADMLVIQLDDEALFYVRWRERLLEVLDADTVAEDARYSAVRDAVEHWGGHASVDSAGFRLVRGWRQLMISQMLAALTAEVRTHDDAWRYASLRSEEWAWPLFSEAPAHLLDPRLESWRDQALQALDQLLHNLGVRVPDDVAAQTWGRSNVARVQHPLSQALPLVGRWLDMPPESLPGDGNVPRVQAPRFGASQRMAVSPGDEAHGYFHMPGGQSGHPRSPYYGAGHDDWVAGRPTPFLPGAAERTLNLLP